MFCVKVKKKDRRWTGCYFPSQEEEHFLLHLWSFLYATNGTRSIPRISPGVQFCFPANDGVFDLCVATTMGDSKSENFLIPSGHRALCLLCM